MSAPAFLTDLVVVFGIAVVVAVALSRLRLPVITGFIAAGALIGPGGLRLIPAPERIHPLAEVGVVLLLFTIGLEFSMTRLRRLWKLMALGGGLQVGLTTAVVMAIAWWLGLPPARGVFFGFLVALSSTAIVLRSLTDRGEIDAPHGRMIVGALIFQDLAVVPMMLVVPMLGGGQIAVVPIAGALARALGIMAVTLLFGRLVIPRLLAPVATARARELFLLTVLFLVMGIAWLTSLAGLSLALGAFLAGIALAESEYGHQALSDVIPFRDTFTSLFFVSIGMLLDVRILVEEPLVVLFWVLAVLVGKTVIAAIAAMAMRFPARVALLSGIGLAQIGEFSFVLIGVGAGTGLLDAGEARLFIAMSVVTMVVTPLLAIAGPHIAAGAAALRRLEQAIGGSDVAGPAHEPEPGRAGHIIIVGYGPAGQLLAEALGKTDIPVLVVDLTIENVRRARAHSVPVTYGDVTSVEILERAGVRQARELVILINDPEATRRAVAAARRYAPAVPIVVRARYVADLDRLLRLGATDVVTEEFETSTEILARVLRTAGVPRNVIHQRIEHARARGVAIVRPVTVPRRMLGEIRELAELKIESFLVQDETWANGATMAEFHLIIAGRATVVALRRGGKVTASPRAFESMVPGDVVYIVGDRAGVDEALELLEEGPKE